MLRGKGIYNQSEYITFLQLMEAVACITSKDESQDQQKISSAELKEALAYAKSKKVDNAKDKQDNDKYFGESRRESTSTLSAGSRRTVMLFDALGPQVETHSLTYSLTHSFIHSFTKWRNKRIMRNLCRERKILTKELALDEQAKVFVQHVCVRRLLDLVPGSVTY